MRHRKSGRKLGVVTKHRKAIFRNMATDLLRNEKINTTDTRAKEIRRVVEKLITLGKNGSLHARRKALAYIRDRVVVEKLFSELAERYMNRPGGYTRIVKLGYRKGDNAPISIVELIEEKFESEEKKEPESISSADITDEGEKSSKKKSAEDLGLVKEEHSQTTEQEQPQTTVEQSVETEQTDIAATSDKSDTNAEKTQPAQETTDTEQKQDFEEKPKEKT